MSDGTGDGSINKAADIVVVDEDEQTRRAAEMWLRREGYEAAVCVPNAGAALRFLDAYQPRFAVLDVTTMGADGLSVLEAIRRVPRLQGLALVVHIAVPESAGGAATDAADATEFRSQPFLTNGINWPGMRAEMEKYSQ